MNRPPPVLVKRDTKLKDDDKALGFEPADAEAAEERIALEPQVEETSRKTFIVKKPKGKSLIMDDNNEEGKEEQKSMSDPPESRPIRDSAIVRSKLVPDPIQDRRLTAFRNSRLGTFVSMRSS